MRRLALIGMICVVASVAASAQPSSDAAALFGAREAISHVSISPDGTKVAFLGPATGRASVLFTLDTTAGWTPKAIMKATGDPERLFGCEWISNARLICRLGGNITNGDEIIGFSSTVAVNDDGTNLKLLSKRQGANALYTDYRGGGVIDFSPGDDASVLMMRAYVPESNISTRIEKTDEGMGVDLVNSITGRTKRVEPPRLSAVEYITDGRGTVRIAGLIDRDSAGYASGTIDYKFRKKGSREWEPLSTYNFETGTGFNPYAVDPAQDIVYGFRKIEGRQVLVSVTLSPDRTETVILKRDDVDVDGLMRIGRHKRVVGASFATERRQAVYFDPDLKKLVSSLGKALPSEPLIEIVDASDDESKLLIWAGGDTSPGTYYLFDRKAKKLDAILPVRPELAKITLSAVKPLTYPAADGTQIPAYLTLPPGSDGKNLPAIVMPHGGPTSRDEWGFDFLPQYFANLGFAVIQPNFRGSSGYGDAWYQKNGFQSWRTSIGDVADAGRWLVKTGVADPAKLTIFGWSYGGYAALQAAVLDPALFKRVVAVAPVTDLANLKRDARNSFNRRVEERFIGSGTQLLEGSPAQNAAVITAPVLMFHGDQDNNVSIRQSRIMAEKLRSASKSVKLIEYPGLEHSLVDSAIRTDMLKRSAEFLLQQ